MTSISVATSFFIFAHAREKETIGFAAAVVVVAQGKGQIYRKQSIDDDDGQKDFERISLSLCEREKEEKPRVCVCVCTVRTTGHKFQHSRPLLVRPDTDAINPRVRRALFSSLFLKGFLILFLLFSFPLCVWAWLLAASTQQPASLHTTRRNGIYKRKEWITRKIKYKIRERKKIYTAWARSPTHTQN